MPATPSPRLLAATTASAAAFVVLVPSFFAAGPARAQQSSSGGASLDLTLNTGASSAPKKTSSPVVSRRGSPRGGGRGAVASRGRTTTRQGATATDQQVLGKLGIVIVDRAFIRRDADLGSRILSPVARNTYVAVAADQGDFFGVRMSDGSMGYVAKNQIRVSELVAAVRDPNAPIPPPPPPADEAPSSGVAFNDSWLDSLDERTQALLREGATYLGVPYVWGGNTRAGVDCSGFVKNVFATQGVSLPRHSGDQARVGMLVDNPVNVQPGDRLYFDMGNKGRVSHTGIYLGGGYFIHASSNQRKVGVDMLTGNYAKGLFCIRR